MNGKIILVALASMVILLLILLTVREHLQVVGALPRQWVHVDGGSWPPSDLPPLSPQVNRVTGPQTCKIDEDCAPGDFCYFGRCWGYWRGQEMPWSTCKNPYCGSVDPAITCSAATENCLPYCKCQVHRKAGGSIAGACFPKCGAPCTTNDECPQGCPECKDGTCQAPTPGEFIL